MNVRSKLLMGVLGCALIVGASRSNDPPSAKPQVAAADVERIKVDPALGQFDGARACERCHTAPLPTDKTDYIHFNEFKRWNEEDKHSIAFAVLKQDRAQQMGKTLGLDPLTANACLNCHAVNVPPELRAASFTLDSGVSCDACHGPSQKWFREHQLPDWRAKPPAEKEKLGFTNVRDVVKQARLCASCHVGDAEMNRLVTHEMYAAGHPPLPSFELATFCEQMPRHWRHLKEKNADLQKLLAGPLQIDPEEHPQAKSMLVSGAVALDASLRLVQHQAADARPWPELAHYDCFACHHDLKSPGARQRRNEGVGPPGRPPLRRWPEALAGIGLELLGEKPDGLVQRLRPLKAAFGAQPFGRREEVQQRTGPLVVWSDQHVQRIAKLSLKDTEALRLLHLLARWPESTLVDYDSARQLAWAFQIAYERRFPAASRQGEPHARIGQILKELDASLKLQLPAGKQRHIEADLVNGLQRRYAFDVEEFRKRFRELAGLLPKQ